MTAAPQPDRPRNPRAPLSRWLLAHLVFFALLAAAFSPVWLGGKLIAPMDLLTQMYLPWRGDVTVPVVHNHFVSDAITQYIPYRWFAHQSLRADGYVGWNDLNYCGTPQYSNTMTTSFDWTVQLHRWLGFWEAWHLGLFLEFWIAGAGMLVFLRSRGLSPLAGLLGAICYAGNFQFVAWIYHRWALGSFCWMPLVLWALVPLIGLPWAKADVWRRIPFSALLAPILLCLAFFGGSLQHAAFVVIAVGCLGLAAVLEIGWRPLAWVRCLAVFAAIGVLGMALAWIMFGPCVASFIVNQTATSRAQGFGYPAGALQPLFNLAVYPFFAFPWPLGAPNTLDLWKFFKTDLFYLPYIGFLPAVLAVAGIFSRRVPAAAKILMAAGFLIPLTPLVAPLYHRVFLVGILGAVWAACSFADGLEKGEARLPARWLAILFGAGSLLWLIAGAVVVRAHTSLAAKLSAIIEKSAVPENFATFPQWFLSRGDQFLHSFPPWSALSLAPWLLAICGCVLLLAFAYDRRIARPALLIGLCLLAAVELSLLADRWITFSPRESSPAAMDPGSPDLYPAPPIVASIRGLDGPVRLYTEAAGPYANPFPPNTLATFGLATLRGYDSITDKIMDGVAVSSQASPRFPELAITHALVAKPLSDPRWKPLRTQDGLLLYEFIGRGPLYGATGGTNPNVEVLGSTQNHRLLRAEGGTIRVAENWNEGWRYRVNDGPWMRPAKNSDLSMGLLLDAPGAQKIEMRFDPGYVDNAPKITMIAWGILLLVWVGALWSSRARLATPD